MTSATGTNKPSSQHNLGKPNSAGGSRQAGKQLRLETAWAPPRGQLGTLDDGCISQAHRAYLEAQRPPADHSCALSVNREHPGEGGRWSSSVLGQLHSELWCCLELWVLHLLKRDIGEEEVKQLGMSSGED